MKRNLIYLCSTLLATTGLFPIPPKASSPGTDHLGRYFGEQVAKAKACNTPRKAIDKYVVDFKKAMLLKNNPEKYTNEFIKAFDEARTAAVSVDRTQCEKINTEFKERQTSTTEFLKQESRKTEKK